MRGRRLAVASATFNFRTEVYKKNRTLRDELKKDETLSTSVLEGMNQALRSMFDTGSRRKKPNKKKINRMVTILSP